MSKLESPRSLTEEHRELFKELRELAEGSDAVGSNVRALLTLLEPHFESEEETAMPLLGALGPLSRREGIPEPEVATLHAKLEAVYPKMLKEHMQVKQLVDEVRRSAQAAGAKRALAIMDELEHHAEVEEDVLYPAALLVGSLSNRRR